MKSNHYNNIGEKVHYTHLFHIILPLIFVIIWILDSFVFKFSTLLAGYIPLIIRIILCVSVLVFAFILWGTAHKALFGKLFNPERHKPETLVTNGIFAHLRHPMYLGNLLVLLSCILLTMSLISLLAWVIIFIFFDRQATHEEQYLEKSYGEDYLAYKSCVPKWLPRIKTS